MNGLTGDQVVAALLCVATLPAIVASLRLAIVARQNSRWCIAGATVIGGGSMSAAVLQRLDPAAGFNPMTMLGAIVALGLLSWGLILESVPLMPAVNRSRAILDSVSSAVLITAIGWNAFLIAMTYPATAAEQVLVVVVLLLLLIPTAFAAAGSVNDPSDRRLRRCALACGAATLTGIAGLVGPAIGKSGLAFSLMAVPTLVLLSVALGTESNGTRAVIDLTTRLGRRRRVTVFLNVLFVISLLAAMWTRTDHEVMGMLTTAVLILIIASQASSSSENLRLTGQLAEQVESLALSAEKFRMQAATDELTGLMNRRAFVARLDAELLRGAPCSVLFVDLDRFKEVNDSLGHDAGDDLLVQLGQRLSDAVKDVATVARFGGDEFIVLVPDTPNDRAALACGERLLATLTKPVFLDGTQTFVAGSIGAARSSPTATSATLLSDADAAMYAAKAQGRNRVALFTQDLRDRVAGRLQVANELHLAIERNELRVHYQPIVSLDTADLSGFEALVRWEHPSRGLLAPGDFIDVAEDTGLIVPLGAKVLTSACTQLAEWIRTGIVDEDTTVSVNLAPRQLSDPSIIAVVADALAEAGLPGGNLHLELTESALMSDAPEVDSIVAALGELGVRFAVDDFGTGYSSLTYLKRFPISVLKVDREFVDGLPHDAGDVVIVNAVVSLAAGMGFRCVAEGVEHTAQAEYLRSIGCSHAQGYLFAKPMPPEDFAIWAHRLDAPSIGRSSTTAT